MLRSKPLSEEANHESTTTTVRAVLEQVVGLNDLAAIKAMKTLRITIGGNAFTDLDQTVDLQLGSWIDLEGYTRMKVIKAHFRTLDFYSAVS